MKLNLPRQRRSELDTPTRNNRSMNTDFLWLILAQFVASLNSLRFHTARKAAVRMRYVRLAVFNSVLPMMIAVSATSNGANVGSSRECLGIKEERNHHRIGILKSNYEISNIDSAYLAYDQVYGVGAAASALGAETVGMGLNIVSQAVGNPNLGEGFQRAAQHYRENSTPAAQAGMYDASDPNIQTASFGVMLATMRPGPGMVPAARPPPTPQYYIQEGVRRSVASREAGLTHVPATVFREGQAPMTTTLPLNQLFSPKAEIPLNNRFLSIQPPILVPIRVEPIGLPGQVQPTPLLDVKLVP